MTGRVLFVCDHNAIRSPMAAALLEALGGVAESGGIAPGDPDILSQAVMEEVGLTLPHAPRPVAAAGLDRFERVIALSPEGRDRMLEMTRGTALAVEYWQLADPSLVDGSREMRLAAYRAARDELLKKLKERFGSGG